MTNPKLVEHIERRSEWDLHERRCETVVGTKVPTNERTGETYDVYIIPHCDCWVSQATDSISLEYASRILLDIANRIGRVQHGRNCARLYPETIVYRGRKEKLWKNCNCWITDWEGEA